MKQHWQRMVLRIDALTLRERAIVFAMVALILVVLVNTALLDPRFAKQKQLTQRIKQDQSVMAGLQAQIQQRMIDSQKDPDKENKSHLQELKDQVAGMQGSLRNMGRMMVAPEKVPTLLEDILQRNHGLHLVSLKTLAVVPLMDQMVDNNAGNVLTSVAQKPGATNGRQEAGISDAVYKHGVEIVVQGGYLDLMNYLGQLESLPWQVLWTRAALEVKDYPRCTLTLTLYTLSLDRKWLNL